MPRRGSDLLFALLVLLALALTVIAGLVLSGRLVSDPSRSDETAPPPPPAAKPRPPQTQTQAAATTRTKPPKRKAPQIASVQVAATRGDCWVAAHAGSADGAILLERVLRSGERVTLRARRIWLELGAAGNVDITLNGKQRPISSGTTKLILG